MPRPPQTRTCQSPRAWCCARHPPQPLLDPGYEVCYKQRGEEYLLDIDDVTVGHRTHMTHDPAAE